jgi:hypothetical protein
MKMNFHLLLFSLWLRLSEKMMLSAWLSFLVKRFQLGGLSLSLALSLYKRSRLRALSH